jgi:hypothetical protein
MKNFDLESKIKSVRVPERGEDYWETLPQRVLTQLRAVPAERPVRRNSEPLMAWGFGVALACLVAALCLWQSRTPKAITYALLRDERELRQNLEQFPSRVGRLMQDEHGLHHLIEDPQ